MSPAHVLYGCRARAIARRADNDDVLFSIDRSDTPLALVHLTWSGRQEADPSWPYTVLLRTVDELADEP